MNFRKRIKNLESLLGTSDSGFCRCGTSYFDLHFVAKQKRKINETCGKCGKAVKPETYAQFIERTRNLPIILLRPKVNNEYKK